MKIGNNYILRELMGEYLLVPAIRTADTYNGMIAVNETGAFLWNCLLTETTEESLVTALLSEYDVTEEEAATDVRGFTDVLRKAGILIEREENQ